MPRKALAPALVRGAVGVARRPTNAGQQSAQPNAEGSTANPAPSENRAGAGWIQKGNHVRIRYDIVKDHAGRQFLRTVAVRFEGWSGPWSGVPP